LDSLDQTINDLVKPFADSVSNFIFFPIKLGEGLEIPIVLVYLVASAVILTLYFRFINIRLFRLAVDVVRGKYEDKNQKGEVSHFQALTSALSGTVGLGNIAGVAVAISAGGPGATFWMILAGFLGMSSKFAECTLGVHYRDIDPVTGTVYGGPMYYLKKGFAQKNLPNLGKILAVFFSIMCVGGSLGGGNMLQSNQSVKQLITVTGLQHESGKFMIGLILATLVGIVIIGGIKRIGAIAEKLVPFMVGIYLLSGLFIIGVHIDQLETALKAIFYGAFSSQALYGGILGTLIQGFRRAFFSNESGIGSAPIAHSAVKTNHPASEGIVSLLEPFIDTVVVCTITALVIVFSGLYGENAQGLSGVDLTNLAFSNVIPGFPYVLALVVTLFAFSTMISWSYYGLQGWFFLFGKKPWIGNIYKIIFCCFTVLGAATNLQSIIDFSDAMIFAMALPNLIGVFSLLGVVKSDLNEYLQWIQIQRNKN
jgi:alanine or glycine:cation symporter, AGCS family